MEDPFEQVGGMQGSGTQDGGVAAGRKWRVTFNSPVVLSFAAACCIATFLGYLTGGIASLLLFETYFFSPLDLLGYVRLFTHVLGHSGFEHLIGNMAYILLLGPLLEEKYGSRALIAVIASTAFSCALVNNVLFPSQALMGASGVVFAFILLSSITSAREGEIPLTFILIALIYLGQQVYEGLFVADNVSQLSHIIGGVVGAAAGFALARRGTAVHG